MTAAQEQRGLDSAATFQVLWACAALFHQAAEHLWSAGPWHAAVTVFAFSAVAWPRQPIHLGALAMAQVIELWTSLPYVSNHWWFLGLVNVAVLYRLAADRLSRPPADRAEWFRRLRPAVVGGVITMWLMAALHKLNWDYLARTTSCAAELYLGLAERGLPLPTGAWAQWAAICGSLAIEVSIPLLLLSRRWGVIGIGVGVIFHSALALYPGNQFFNFAAVLFACYFCWFRPRVGGDAGGASGGERWPLRAARALWLTAGALALVAGRRPDWRLAWVESARWLFVLYGIGIGVLFWRAWRDSTASPTGRLPTSQEMPRRLSITTVLVPCLVLFNGLAPYVGWKTETAFGMYSNLRTEGPEANHLFLRGKLFGRLQDDLVSPFDSNDPNLKSIGSRGLAIPRFQLASYLAERPQVWVEISSPGGRLRVDEANRRVVLGDPPYWQRKLVYFRPIRPHGPVPCLH